MSVSLSHSWEASRGACLYSCSLVLSLSQGREDPIQLFSFFSAFSDPGKPGTLTSVISPVPQEFIESCRPSLHQELCSHPCTLALLHQTPGQQPRALICSRDEKPCITPYSQVPDPSCDLILLGDCNTYLAQEQSRWIRLGNRGDLGCL